MKIVKFWKVLQLVAMIFWSGLAHSTELSDINSFFNIYDDLVNDKSKSIHEMYTNLTQIVNMTMKYSSSSDYRTHYINNSLAVYDEPVIINHYYVSDFMFEGIKIPFIFELSKVQFVSPSSITETSGNRNIEETDFTILVDFGRYWNPTDGLVSYGVGITAYTFPDSTLLSYDYGAVAYAQINREFFNPFVKNIYHMAGRQRNCFEFVVGITETFSAESTLRCGYEADVYYRRYNNSNEGFTNADLTIFVGYGLFTLKARWVPFLDSKVLEDRFGGDWCGFDNGAIEIFLAYEFDF